MKRIIPAVCIAASLVSGCSIQEAIHKNDDRYLRPGALDLPLAQAYDRYSYAFMKKYRITHLWLRQTACAVGGLDAGTDPSDKSVQLLASRDIYEVDGKTYQAAGKMGSPRNIDRYVRSVPWVSNRPGEEGKVYETGWKALCSEAWVRTSHYLSLTIQKQSAKDFEKSIAEWYGSATWSTEIRNGLTWRVARVPDDRLSAPPLNGVGGPYRIWIVALGDTGYSMSAQMGASTESLPFPQSTRNIEAALMRIVDSVRIEPLPLTR